MKPSTPRLLGLAACLAASLAASLAAAAVLADLGPEPDHAERGPLVIGHRGACGYLPDHTLAGYSLAVDLGADYIETDLVMTKDGHLVARHEPNIVATTDVKDHPEFASRRRRALVDGVEDEGFFVSDFTLKELKTLRAVQPFADRPQQPNGRFEIPTFEEILELARHKSRQAGRTIGIYPETKHPTYHRQLGLPLEPALLRELTRAGLNHRRAPVFIQSFEQGNLKALRRLTDVRLVQLVDANDVNPDGTLDYTPPYDRPYDWTVSGDPVLLARTFGFFATDAGLREIATYGEKKLLPPSDLIQRAHRAGLKVHTWTFRNEQKRLADDYAGNPVAEYLQFFGLGVDGVFSDFADTAFASRAVWRYTR